VLNDFEGERVIQRVTVMGDEPKAASPSPWQPYRSAYSSASWRDQSLWKFLKARAQAD